MESILKILKMINKKLHFWGDKLKYFQFAWRDNLKNVYEGLYKTNLDEEKEIILEIIDLVKRQKLKALNLFLK